jgi:branched-chain amino acid transport system ATP-binding protein/branched-chain amino acid transport system permease protein
VTTTVDRSPGALLELNQVSKRFGGIQAVRDLTFRLAPGRVTGLVGPNGAGKTTMFNLVTGFLPADSGSIRYRDHDITDWPPYRISRVGIARSFQDVRIFPRMSALDNVMVAGQDQAGERVLSATFSLGRVARDERLNRERSLAHLEFVGLGGKARVFAQSLSYSEQKLLALARMLATEAECLLLDEPMAGLDPGTRHRINQLIRELVPRGKTVCLIEHNLDVVQEACDWLVFLDQGHVVAEGLPSEIVGDSKLAEIYFGA